MSEPLFPKTHRLIQESVHRQQLTEYCDWLLAEQYSALAVHNHMLSLEYAMPRLRTASADQVLGHEDLLRAFDSRSGPPPRRRSITATRRAYRRFLRDRGRFYDDGSRRHRFWALLQAYDHHLADLRGLVETTRAHHTGTITAFLDHALGSTRPLSALEQDDVERFVSHRSQSLSRHSMQHVVGHLRAFLRYCRDHGHIDAAVEILDTPRIYRGELPPKALPWAVVEALLASIDHHSDCGWRDHCILHLLANYGIRPSELIALRLDSIDWERDRLRVIQSKTGSELVLPLAPQTIALLQGYLEHDRLRRTVDSPALFLRVTCPYTALSRYAVTDIYTKRVRLANLEHAISGGVYRLRHSFAMRLLNRGVGIKAIGDVLGHRRWDTTCTYLRLDVDTLRVAALEVPTSVCAGGGHV